MNEPAVEIPSVDWWITSHCILACDFCYGPKPTKDPVDQRGEILEALSKSSARVVTFCGGEPLLVGNIGEYAGMLKKVGKAAVLNTNGQLLRRRFDQGLELGNFAMVGLSVDGSAPEIHREMRGVGADLDEVLAAADRVAAEPGVGLKIATVVSSVNKEDLFTLAGMIKNRAPAIWRLYQYSSRGEVNEGQTRHRISDDEFGRLAKRAAELAYPVPAAPSSEAETEGCLIVDPTGGVLQPKGGTYVRYGNCLTEPINDIWARIPTQSTIISNKHWLTVLD